MKKLLLTSAILFILSLNVKAQFVETVVPYHTKIVDGLHVDSNGDVFTTSGGLVGGVEIGKYDVSEDEYDANFAIGFSGPIDIDLYKDSLFVITNFDNNTVCTYTCCSTSG